MSECFGIMSIPPSASIVSWDGVVSLTKIIPNCSPMDPLIIDLQLGLMETV